nr:helix-turn-helix transcriptional regulator [Pseudoxanthomonas sp.]
MSKKLYLRVRQAREHAGLTQEQLAVELGLTRSAIAQWEMIEGTCPSIENMIALAQCTGMGFEFLATGRGPAFIDNPNPRIAEEGSGYGHELNEQQRRLLERFDGLSPRQRTGLLDLIGDGGKRRRR